MSTAEGRKRAIVDLKIPIAVRRKERLLSRQTRMTGKDPEGLLIPYASPKEGRTDE